LLQIILKSGEYTLRNEKSRVARIKASVFRKCQKKKITGKIMKKLTIKALFAPILGIALALMGVQQADATGPQTTGTMTVTGTASMVKGGTQLAVNSFNSSLGTLDSVTITLSGVQVGSTVTVSNTSGSEYVSDLYTTVTLTLKLGTNSLVTVSGVTTGDASYDSDTTVTGIVTPATGSGENTASVVSNIVQQFSSSTGGLMNLTLNSAGNSSFTEAGTENVGVTTTAVRGTATATVTYTYTALPEPSTWAMVFGGVGALALVQRFRRSHV
jgi:hypothetical protein